VLLGLVILRKLERLAISLADTSKTMSPTDALSPESRPDIYHGESPATADVGLDEKTAVTAELQRNTTIDNGDIIDQNGRSWLLRYVTESNRDEKITPKSNTQS
jgi:hypothetical protein